MEPAGASYVCGPILARVGGGTSSRPVPAQKAVPVSGSSRR